MYKLVFIIFKQSYFINRRSIFSLKKEKKSRSLICKIKLSRDCIYTFVQIIILKKIIGKFYLHLSLMLNSYDVSTYGYAFFKFMS